MNTQVVCQRCGAPAEGALFCPRCGAEVSGVQGSATMSVGSMGGSPLRQTMQQTLRAATLGEYDILAELGRGGMATVFLAHDIALDRRVAIKVMAPHLFEGEGMVERFKLEARTAAQLSHPHIIPIYAVRETEETLFFVMKFIEGRPLDSIIKKLGPLPIPMVKDILTRVGGALGYAHRREVVHRDVKPGNIMIDEEGTPIMTDFGIAKVAEAPGLTATGAAIGTPSYMSPEQCEGREVTGASDQYSLGILAFEMLTGKLPFTGESAVSIMYRHCQDPLPPLEDFRPDCPPELREIVERMTAKDPADRWPSLEAAVQKLGAHSTLSFYDPIRTQMIAIVQEGEQKEILARIRTPRSPVPRVTGRATAAEPAASRPRRGRAALIGAAVVVLLGTGAALVVRPWAGESDAEPNLPARQAESAGTAGEGPAPAEGAGVTVAGATTATSEAGEAGAGDAGAGATDGAAGGTRVADAGAPDETPAGGGAGAAPGAGAGAGAGVPPPPVMASVRVGGLAGPLLPEESVRLTAVGLDARGVSLGSVFPTWSSSDPEVARVSAGGVLTGVSPGDAFVTAEVGGLTSSVSVRVLAETVASLSVRPRSVSLTVGETASLGVTATSAAGRVLGDRPVAWSSDAPGTVEVSGSGVVRALAPGSARVTATAEGVAASVDVVVAAPPVSTREAVEQAVAAYARALEARDIARVREVYPGMTAQQETELRGWFGFMNDLRADLHIDALEESGDRATAQVSGTYTFRNASTNRQERADITFRAVFQRVADGWRLIETR